MLHAANGAEGLQLWLQHRSSIALVFLDLMMPVLDGFRTALNMRRIEAERNWLRVPIVAHTSEHVPRGSPLWARCMESGMDEVVVSWSRPGFFFLLAPGRRVGCLGGLPAGGPVLIPLLPLTPLLLGACARSGAPSKRGCPRFPHPALVKLPS